MFLTFVNLGLLFGYSFRAKRYRGKWKQNLDGEYLLAMMDQNPSNITMRKRVKFSPHETFASFLSLTPKLHRNLWLYYQMDRVRGSLGVARCRHRKIQVMIA